MRIRPFVKWLLPVLVACLGATAPSRAQTALKPVERSEDDLLLLALVLDGAPLTSDFEGYDTPHGLLVPLGEMCRLLGLGVTVDPKAGTATGFLLHQSRTFSLDLAQGTALLAGKPLPFDAQRVELHLRDIYVATTLLDQWLPLRLRVEKAASVIVVEPQEPLPLQLQLDRQRRAGQLPSAGQVLDRGYPRLDNPYRLLTPPALDQTLSLQALDVTRGGAISSLGSTYLTGDLLGMSAECHVIERDFRIDGRPRLELYRTDPAGGLLGGLRAREVRLGDVFVPSAPLVASGASGPGLVVSSFPLFQQEQYDVQTFRGRLEPDWDVELYREAVLLGYEHSPANGQYEFKDIPLYFGFNRFTLAFYGPRGERRTEERVFYVGENLTPPGENYYRLSACNADSGGTRLLWQQEIGLRRDLSLSNSLSHVESGRASHDYAGLGLQTSCGSLSARGEVIVNFDGGAGMQAGVQTRVGPTAVNLQYRLLGGLDSELYPGGGGGVRSQALLQLSAIPLPRWCHLQPADMTVSHTHYGSGSDVFSGGVRLSSVSRSLALSNVLAWEHRTTPGARSTTQAAGSLLASRRVGAWLARGQLDYDMAPRAGLSRVSLDLQTRLKPDYAVSLGVSHGLAGDHETVVSVGVSTRTDSVYIGPAAAYDSAGGALGLGVSLATTLTRDVRTGAWRASPDASAALGAASVRVFLDRDGDGKFGAGDRPLKGATFLVNGLGNPLATDATGVALLTGLAVDQPTDLSVNTGSLGDPLWTPVKPGVRFQSRPGNTLPVEFAVVALGEVSGTVTLSDGRGRRPLGGVPIELADAQGKAVVQDRTAYDGFYVLSKVPPGVYQLRLAPAETERLGLQPLAREVTVSPEGGFADTKDLVVTPAAKASP